MFQEKTVLIVDDDAFSRQVFKNMLSSDYNVLEADNAREAFDVLIGISIEISAVLVDLIMPEIDGCEFIKMLQSTSRYSNTPVIVITGNDDIESEVNALESGAWDYVVKPCNPKILQFRLKNAIDRSQLSIYRQFKHKVEYDELTELFQRNKFFDEVEKLMSFHSDQKFALCRMDIDRFKMYNIYFGIPEGDKLLRFIAQQIRLAMIDFENGISGRIEDDIFCFLVPYDKEKIIYTIQCLKQALVEYNRNYDIVPSFGIYPIEDNTLPASVLYDRVTMAAKEIKGSYINFYAFYDDNLRQNLMAEQEIINEMNYALLNNQFIIYLQPKWDITTGKPVGSEALVRWMHPKKGLISPGMFLPIFEKNGFVSKLDFYIWETTCKLIRRWLDEGRPILPISVNISRINLYNMHLASIIVELVKKYDLDPKLLRLELTESAYSDDPEIMQKTMNELREAGFKISMDDFGSGYSSLNMLKDIFIDELKIDMKFFSRGNEDRGATILESVVNMAHTLGIPVIAEGVETIENANFLKEINCKYVQGYYFAKPMPVDDFEKLVDEKL